MCRSGIIVRVPGIYDEPEFYEAACAYRDVPSEVDALLRWYDAHRGPEAGPLRSVLELAAGPAEHSRELARHGVEATALDLSAAMCARAGDMAAAARSEERRVGKECRSRW